MRGPRAASSNGGQGSVGTNGVSERMEELSLVATMAVSEDRPAPESDEWSIGLTLVVAAVCPDYAVQVSDRRLTTRSRADVVKVFTDEENKSIFWNLPMARFAVAYTGIARIGATSMERFLCDQLMAAAERGNYEPNASIEALRRSLSWSMLSLPRQARRLSLMLSGFVAPEDDVPFVAGCLLTNFQIWGSHDDADAWDEFTALYEEPRAGVEWPTLMQKIGAWDIVDDAEVEEIRALLEQRKPPEAVVGKILDCFPGWAKGVRPTSTVGRQASSLVIRIDHADSPTWAYHTHKNSRSIYGGATVIARAGGSVAAANVEIRLESEGSAAVPQVPRRRPCPCGSRKQYRLCHGRINPHRPVLG